MQELAEGFVGGKAEAADWLISFVTVMTFNCATAIIIAPTERVSFVRYLNSLRRQTTDKSSLLRCGNIRIEIFLTRAFLSDAERFLCGIVFWKLRRISDMNIYSTCFSGSKSPERGRASLEDVNQAEWVDGLEGKRYIHRECLPLAAEITGGS